MTQIQLSDEKFEKLTERAHAAGYRNVEGFIDALIDEPTADPRGLMSQQALRESAADCDRINEAMKAGGGQDAREALVELGKKLGLSTPQ